ncbi:MAG: arylamine N-acetyltransferase [Acidimicrobiales bacterium]
MTSQLDTEQYLARIGFDYDQVALDLATLEALQRSHLSTVPFENLDVYRGQPVRCDLAHSVPKVVERRRGGWCFELNGAFSALLTELGFEVRLLGAAVLLGGPNAVIDHLTLEVQLDEPYLVDVGFGDSFISPLRLNFAGEQDGGSGTFQLIASSQGTTLARIAAGVPEAQYRFKRVDRKLTDFIAASDELQANRELHWSQKPFATRLIDGGPDRVTLLKDRLKICRDGVESTKDIEPKDWDRTLSDWFKISL